MRVKTLIRSNLVRSRRFKVKNASLPVDAYLSSKYTFKSLKKKSEGKYIGAPSPIFAEGRGGGAVCTQASMYNT